MKKPRLMLIAALTLASAACQHNIAPTRLVGEAQGTYYSIVYYDAQQRDLSQSIDSLLHAFDLTASLWNDSSEIVRFNECADSMTVSPLMADLYTKSMQIHQLTDGAFDCRVGPLVRAYGFARTSRVELSDSQIDSLRTLCLAPLTLDTNSSGQTVLHKSNPAQRIDFNAIAQGYSVDLVCHMLSARGIDSYVVDIGGEVRAHGTKTDGSPWKVGIERPAATSTDAREVEIAIQLTDLSVVTSGSYRKYYEKDGQRFSHTIDPATGRPVAHTTLSTSVIDTTAWRADALATAFMVMGQQRAIEWLARHPETNKVFFINDSLGTYTHYSTPAFQEHILD